MGAFEKQINFSKIPINKVRKWITFKSKKILGLEDEIFIDYCMNQLKYKTRKSLADEELHVSPIELVNNIEGFLGDRTYDFVKELWDFLEKQEMQTHRNRPGSFEMDTVGNRLDGNSNTEVSLTKVNKNLGHSDGFRVKPNSSFSEQIPSANEKISNICNDHPNYKKREDSYQASDTEDSSSRLLTEAGKRKSTQLRRKNRSFSRSLSPESYGVNDFEQRSSERVHYYKEKLRKSETRSPLASSRKTPRVNGLNSIKSDKMNLKNKMSIREPKADPKDNADVEGKNLSVDGTEKEYSLRMKALELIKRKNNEGRNNRTESEEALRIRALKKFMNKKLMNHEEHNN
ncbi:putative pre-mRNA splicing factor [Cryptosporidium felis]|nr:putative pre-mRNA splicing factor [Cryptosporidium felis]